MCLKPLFCRRGVDKKVLQLLRDRTEGNTLAKVWRQIQENHCQDYLNRTDLYTTLLTGLTQPGGIVAALGHKFDPPPSRRELPSARLLQHAFLLSEATQIQDYRAQILSTFGTVLKMDSTKKVHCETLTFICIFWNICIRLCSILLSLCGNNRCAIPGVLLPARSKIANLTCHHILHMLQGTVRFLILCYVHRKWYVTKLCHFRQV